MENYLTEKQMSLITKLGRFDGEMNYVRNRKTHLMYISCTVDTAIDWLRRKHNTVIYNSIPPFVDPTAKKKPCILYRFTAKYCNLRDGWNGRKTLGNSNLTNNIYAAKRQAINIAIKWLLNENKTSKSTESTTKKR